MGRTIITGCERIGRRPAPSARADTGALLVPKGACWHSYGWSLSFPIRATRIALAAALLLCGSLAHAQGYIPPPRKWLERPVTPETTVPPTTVPPEAIPPHTPPPPPPPPAAPTPQPEAMAPPVLLQREIEEPKPKLSLGAAFTYAQRSENVDITSPLGSAAGSTDVAVYAGRLDATVLGCSFGKAVKCNPPNLGDASVGLVTLNLAVLAGYADGSSEVAGQRTSLHGPVLGTGTLLTMSPPPLAQWSRQGMLAPFLVAGFDYAATDFSAVEGWVHTFDVKPRAGLLVQSDAGALLSVYGGASWHDFTEDQTINGVALSVRPTEPWAPLVGATYRGGEGLLEDFSLTAEGEVGDRTGVVLTLRYEFDVEL